MTNDAPRKRRSIAGVLVLLILVLIVLGIAYVLQRRGFDFRQAFSTVRETSEDAATTTKVKTAFAVSREVSAFDIDVDTRNGVVTLSGEVASAEAKELAVDIARGTSGVTRVVDKLVVDPAARPDPELAARGDQMTDLEIRSAVSEALRTAPDASVREIELSVKNGMVTLGGSAPTEEDKSRAEQLARSVEGVTSVTNEIQVTGGPRTTSPARQDLARRVQFELFLTKAFDLDGIQVDASNGTVTLSGTARSRAESLLAERVAGEVEGVSEVVNNLTVPEDMERPTPPPARPPGEGPGSAGQVEDQT